MISFRFHVVSITAVFLAIAIGVVVGTTYVDGAVVDGLRNRIDTVEENLDERREENAALEGELQAARGYIDASMDFTVTDRLTDVPVLLLAARGIDEGAVERAVALARRAGATVPGAVWLEAGWSLEDEDARRALAEVVDAGADDDADELRGAAWSAVAEEMGVPPEVDVEAGDPPGPGAPAPAIAPLVEAGFLTLDPLGDTSAELADLSGGDVRVLVIAGPRAQGELAPVLPVAIAELADADLPIVVADVHVDAPEAPARGQVLRDSLSEGLRERVVLIDHADRPEGQVAAVLALAGIVDAQLLGTHFGYGDGSAGVLPSWTPP